MFIYSNRLADHTIELHVRERDVLLQDLESLRGALRPAVAHARPVAVRLPGKPQVPAGVRWDRRSPRGVQMDLLAQHRRRSRHLSGIRLIIAQIVHHPNFRRARKTRNLSLLPISSLPLASGEEPAGEDEGQEHQVPEVAQAKGPEGPPRGSARTDDRALQAAPLAQHAARLRHTVRTHQQLLHPDGLVSGIVHQVILCLV